MSDLPLQNETVYYWRAAIDSSLTNGKYNWKTRSFIYRENSLDKAWHHTHHQQWAENNFQNLEFDTTT